MVSAGNISLIGRKPGGGLAELKAQGQPGAFQLIMMNPHVINELRVEDIAFRDGFQFMSGGLHISLHNKATILRCLFVGNGGGLGSALHNEGTAIIKDTIFRNNYAIGAGGTGGALYNTGILRAANVTLEGNNVPTTTCPAGSYILSLAGGGIPLFILSFVPPLRCR